MPTCKQVSELVSLSLDRRLGWFERWRLSVHLKACEGCRTFQQQMSFLRTALRNHPAIKDDREGK
jgi:predicted anti-sigma-YlaC factor YlaD